MTAVPSRVSVPIGPLGAFREGRGRAVVAGGRNLAVFNLGDRLVALDGQCLHRGGPLAEGWVASGVVTCPLHWWRYDLRTGECLSAPGRLACHPIEVRDGEVYVDVEPMPGPDGDAGESLRERLLRRAREWTAEQAAGPR